jgi:hypothetical protein
MIRLTQQESYDCVEQQSGQEKAGIVKTLFEAGHCESFGHDDE